MKILQVVHGFPPENHHGVETYCRNLSCELANKHELSVFTRGNNPGIPEYKISLERRENLNLYAINNTFRDYNHFKETYQNERVAESLEGILDEIKPDVAHIQSLLYLGAGLISKIKERGIPIVFSLHDYWLACSQGQFFKNNSAPCCLQEASACVACVRYQLALRKNVSPVYHFLRQRLSARAFQRCKKTYLNIAEFSWMKKAAAQGAIEERNVYLKKISSLIDVFIAPSCFMKQKFIGLGLEKEKIRHLPYGFRVSDFGPGKPGASGTIRFGFIGNLMPAKGVHVLVGSFNNVRGAELKIFGASSSYKSSLENYEESVRKLADNKNIRFMGSVPNEKIPLVLKELDVLVVPSLWEENAPLVIQEAFLAKVPVIASCIGGIPELVRDHVNGLLFKAGDADGLRSKIQEIINDPAMLDRLKKSIPPVEDIKDHAKKIESLYAGLGAARKTP